MHLSNVNPCTNPPTNSSSGPLVCDQRGEPRPGSGESACAIGAFEPQLLTDFAAFDTGLIVFPNQFLAGGSFTLAADAPAFNPPTQAVTMTLAAVSFGPLAVTIPPGHFKLVKGQYKYSGTLSGIKYGVTFSAPVHGVYEFTFAAFGVDVTGISNPVSVTLQIGANIGTDDESRPRSYEFAVQLRRTPTASCLPDGWRLKSERRSMKTKSMMWAAAPLLLAITAAAAGAGVHHAGKPGTALDADAYEAVSESVIWSFRGSLMTAAPRWRPARG